jgi:hypothetical protein
MAATLRAGWVDSQQSTRLSVGTVYLAIYAGSLPVSDGTGGTEISPATRPAITFGSVAQDFNGRHYQPNVAVNNIVLTNTSPCTVLGFGICTAAVKGDATVIYLDHLPQPFQVAKGATISIPAGAIRMYAEPATI